MTLTKGHLGEYIELQNKRNTDLLFKANSVRGVNTSKQMMPTKADLTTRDLGKFQIVEPGWFFFNHRTSRNGEKFSITYNYEEEPIICTEDYVVFKIKEDSRALILEEWLYLYFNRPEFDRYVITNSWGSSTEFYNWEDLCKVEISLPALSIQKKYVDIYLAMVSNQKSYEKGLEDLIFALHAIIDNYKRHCVKRSLGSLLTEVDNRNLDGEITNVQGINITKQFMPSIANTSGTNIRNYKVVKKGQFAYSGMQTGRDKCIRIALYDQDDPIIISPAYSVLIVNDESVLPEYIMIWFSRKESDRLGWFMSDSSVRANLDLDRFFETEIPIPPLSVQEAIVNIYKAFITRRRINEMLKEQTKTMCPILIKGSMEEANS